MCSMFAGCESLTYVDVSGFETGLVDRFDWMFLDCASLTALDLSSFQFDAATQMDKMFCTSLTNIGCTITVPEWASSEDMYTGSGLE